MGVILNVMIISEIRRQRKAAIDEGLRQGRYQVVKRGKSSALLPSGAHYKYPHAVQACAQTGNGSPTAPTNAKA